LILESRTNYRIRFQKNFFKNLQSGRLFLTFALPKRTAGSTGKERRWRDGIKVFNKAVLAEKGAKK
jgi:hypothetical protein